jgi:hypothetical protein
MQWHNSLSYRSSHTHTSSNILESTLVKSTSRIPRKTSSSSALVSWKMKWTEILRKWNPLYDNCFYTNSSPNKGSCIRSWVFWHVVHDEEKIGDSCLSGSHVVHDWSCLVHMGLSEKIVVDTRHPFFFIVKRNINVKIK